MWSLSGWECIWQHERTCRNLLKRIKLHIFIAPYNVFFTWCLLFNLLLGRKEVDVEDLMQAVQIESMQNVHVWINYIMVRKIFAFRIKTSQDKMIAKTCRSTLLHNVVLFLTSFQL
jgi:hypothetical protein